MWGNYFAWSTATIENKPTSSCLYLWSFSRASPNLGWQYGFIDWKTTRAFVYHYCPPFWRQWAHLPHIFESTKFISYPVAAEGHWEDSGTSFCVFVLFQRIIRTFRLRFSHLLVSSSRLSVSLSNWKVTTLKIKIKYFKNQIGTCKHTHGNKSNLSSSMALVTRFHEIEILKKHFQNHFLQETRIRFVCSVYRYALQFRKVWDRNF